MGIAVVADMYKFVKAGEAVTMGSIFDIFSNSLYELDDSSIML